MNINITPLIIFIALLTACQTNKKVSHDSPKTPVDNMPSNTALQFGCYNGADTLSKLILYFPEEKVFFVNNHPCTQEELCKTIAYDMQVNKPAIYYFAPESNFLYMRSIIKAVEKCYADAIDKISIKTYGHSYDLLSPQQKTVIDSTLSYRMLSK